MTHIKRINEICLDKLHPLKESYGSGALNDLFDGYDLYLFDVFDLERHMSVSEFFDEFGKDLTDTDNVFGFFILEDKGKYTFVVSMKHFIGRRNKPELPIDFALIELTDEYVDLNKPNQIEKFINEYCIEWVKPNEFARKWLPKFENMTFDDICGEDILMKDYFYE